VASYVARHAMQRPLNPPLLNRLAPYDVARRVISVRPYYKGALEHYLQTGGETAHVIRQFLVPFVQTQHLSVYLAGSYTRPRSGLT